MNSIIQLNKFGENLGTRVLGIDASKEFDNLLFEQNASITLDFKDIRVVTNSFADELIGKKVLKIGFAEFKKRVTMINVNDNIKAVIKKSIFQRMNENA